MKGLKRFLRKSSVPEKKKIIMLVDLENLTLNIDKSPETYSLKNGFIEITKTIAREVGQIDNVFVFTPPHLASIHGEELYQQGFSIIFCPKVKDKEGKEEDTVDSSIIQFGSKMIHQIPGLTHLCIVSGDKDFRPLIHEAIKSGLGIVIVAASVRSLSKDLINLADKKSRGGRLVYTFSSKKE